MTAEEKENLLLVAGIPLDNAAAILAKLGSKDRDIAELKSRCFTLERFRIEDAASAINEANQLRETIKELKAEIERLKGEAESRAKDAFSKACQFYENYVPEDYLPVNRPIL